VVMLAPMLLLGAEDAAAGLLFGASLDCVAANTGMARIDAARIIGPIACLDISWGSLSSAQ
jgi:hypothetical protein